jgi:hypothetical protein
MHRMALRAPHGAAVERGNPGPRVEVLPADELPDPLPRPMPQPGTEPRRVGRPFRAGDAAAIAAARAGGLAKAGKVSLMSSLGLAGAPVDGAAFSPYRKKASSFRAAHCRELAALAGGACGSGPSSMVATAALQLGMSRYLFDLAMHDAAPGSKEHLEIVKSASRLGDSSRQNLLAAYELAIREGKSRGKPAGVYDVDEVTRRAEHEAEAARAKRRAALPQTIDVEPE